MIELQTVTTKAKNPSTNEFQDVTWGGINVLSTSGTTNYNNLTNKPTINGVTVQGSLTTGDLLITAADVGALPSGTKYGADFALSIDSQTFVVTAQLKDQDGNNLGQAKTIDLPLETMVVGGSYDDTTQKVILTLKNGQTIEFSVADLISGLQSEITLSNKLDADLVSDVSSENKFVTAAEKTTWNGKQSALTIEQLAAVNSGIDSTDVAQIETNKNNILSAYGGMVGKNAAKENDFTATLNKTVYCNPITGTIHISAANVSSTDTDSTICRILLYYTDGTVSSNNLSLSRGSNISLDINIRAKIIERIVIYASDNYNNSIGDTVTVSDLMICTQADYAADPTYQPYVRTNAELTIAEAEDRAALVELVDAGAKNKYPPFETQSSRGSTGVTYSYTNGIVHATGTKSGSLNYIEVVENWPISELGFSVGDTMTLSNTNDSLLLTIILGDGTTFDPAIIVGNEIKEITIGAGKTHIYIRSQILSSVTGTIDLSATPMICTKAAWDISHAYEPYALPNPTLTPAAIKAVDEGAKNLLKFDYISGGTAQDGGTSWTSNGVEFSLANGEITVNRTSASSSDATCQLYLGNSKIYIDSVCDGGHILSGCPSGGSTSTYMFGAYRGNYTAVDTGSGAELGTTTQTLVYLQITIKASYSPSNLKFRPMICTASDWNVSQKYVPYALTNPTLTADITSLKHMVDPRSQSQVSSGNLDNVTVSEMRVYTSPSGLPTGVSASSVCIVETCVVDSNSAYQVITLLSNQGTAQDRSYPTYKRVKVGGVWYDWKLIVS